MPYTIFDSPFGALTLVAGPDERSAACTSRAPCPRSPRRYDPEALAPAVEQLEQYFAGERTQLRAGAGISAARRSSGACGMRCASFPYGTTTTYGALARELDAQPRAVGAAVGATPIPIVIPCHRVIGTDGSLTGYGGGLPRKRALLDLEAGVAQLALAVKQ